MSDTPIPHAITERGRTVVLPTGPVPHSAGAARPTGPTGRTSAAPELPAARSIGPIANDVPVLLFVPSSELVASHAWMGILSVILFAPSTKFSVCFAPVSGMVVLPPALSIELTTSRTTEVSTVIVMQCPVHTLASADIRNPAIEFRGNCLSHPSVYVQVSWRCAGLGVMECHSRYRCSSECVASWCASYRFFLLGPPLTLFLLLASQLWV